MIEITHRYTDAVLHTVDADTLSGANLHGADLSGANLHGADLSDANLHGADLSGEIITKTPISILNLTWDILITDNYLTIGCKRFTHVDWANFNDDEIKAMESRSSEFWATNKHWLLTLCQVHRETK